MILNPIGRNSLANIESPRQDLTFKQLKIYYEESGLAFNDNFFRNENLLTDTGKYNYTAYLLADENRIPIHVVKYADISFNSEIDLVKRLNDEAKRQNGEKLNEQWGQRFGRPVLSPVA